MQLLLSKKDINYNKIVGLAIVYFFAAKFGFSLAFRTAQVTTIWPPAGIALAAILVFGYEIWPGILLGAFAANLVVGESFFTAAGVAITNTAAAVFVGYLLKNKFNFDINLNRVQDVVLLVGAALVSPLISSTLGVLNLYLSHLVIGPDILSAWLTWSVGDASGILLVTPLLLAWMNKRQIAFIRRNWIEVVAFLAILIIANVLIFREIIKISPLAWSILPFVAWSGLRLRLIGSTTTNFIIAIIAAWGTVSGLGPFTDLSHVESNLVFLFVFIFILSVTNLIGSSVVEEWRIAEDGLKFQSDHDALTGLPNRYYFIKRIDTFLKNQQDTNSTFALLKIDMDRFKVVNDSLGYGVGDWLLSAAGIRINKALPANCIFARLESDEFVVFCECPQNKQEAKNCADKITECLKIPFVFNEHEIYLTASIGISMFPEDGENAYELLKKSRSALMHAKELGRDNAQFFSDSMNIKTFQHLNFETALHHAIENNEFVIHYQPQVVLESGIIAETEALVRWQDQKMGLTLPDKFVPLAEVTGLIDVLGEMVLRESCMQNKIWNNSGQKSLSVAVNISSIQFQRGEFIGKLEKIIEETKINPKNLNLEITERTLLESSHVIMDNMKKMRQWGIKFSLDDFSMGYSSLNYIQKFPIDVLKIDRAFVSGIPDDPASCAIAKSIITLAHNLNMLVVAEGVETLEQLQFFYDNGCDRVQGYIFSSAIPGHSMTEILTEDRYAKVITKLKGATLPLEFA